MKKINFDPRYYVRAYELTVAGCNQEEIAKDLGVGLSLYLQWVRTKPALREAIETAKGRVNTNVPDYIYHQLSPEARAVYDSLAQTENHPDASRKLQAIMGGQNKPMRQLMVIQAMLDFNFNTSRALRRCGIAFNTFKHWMEEDPDFHELWNEVHWHKKNFIEGAMLNLVGRGNVAAILAANKSLNSDRGYAEKFTLKQEHEHTHKHELTIDIADLDLPPQVAAEVLKALERRERKLIEEEATDDGPTIKALPGRVIDSGPAA